MEFTADATIKGLGESDLALRVKGDGGLDLSGVDLMALDPLQALAGLALRVAMDASLSGPTSQSGSVEIRIVDGAIYFKGLDGTNAWQKVSPGQLSLGGLGGDMGGNIGGNIGGDLSGLLGNLTDPRLSRLASKIQTVYSAANGPTIEVSTRAITATTDLKPFLQALADPNIAEVLSQIIPQDDPNVAQLGNFLPLLGALFSKAKVASTNYYGTDGTFRGFNVALDLVVEGQTAAMLTGSPEDIEVRFKLDVRLTKLGEPYTVEAPIN